MNINILLLFFIISIIYFIINSSSYIQNFSNSIEKHKVIVFIPIRNREKELIIILKRLKEIFEKQNIDYKCYILVQTDKKAFNKGKLINSGFNEAKNDKFSDNIIIHDVDVYPKYDNIINYTHKNNNTIRHPYGMIERDPYFLSFKFKKKESLMCLFMLNKKLFIKLNGFSNNFWGWGGEDTDLEHRAIAFKIKVDRSKFMTRPNSNMEDDISGTSIHSPKKSIVTNMQLKTIHLKEYLRDKMNIYKDGLLNCKYKVLKRSDNYTNNPRLVRLLIDI